MNAELVEKIIEHLEAEPLRLKMDWWIERGEQVVAPCKTVACIAGWACLLSDMEPIIKIGGLCSYVRDNGCLTNSVENEAAHLLDIDFYKSNCLFYVSKWPLEYREVYNNAESAKEQVSVVVNYLRHVLATGELDVCDQDDK